MVPITFWANVSKTEVFSYLGRQMQFEEIDQNFLFIDYMHILTLSPKKEQCQLGNVFQNDQGDCFLEKCILIFQVHYPRFMSKGQYDL